MERSISIFFTIFFLYIGLTFSLVAQETFKGIPYIKNYTRQDYRSSPFNWGIVQDNRGMIYVANNYLLMEFDGNLWRFIVLPNRTVVRSLAVDKRGRVYVGGQGDFGFLKPDQKGEMSFVSLKNKISKELQNFDDVWKIYVTNEGVAFCTAAGIYYLINDKIEFFNLQNTNLDLSFYVNDRFFINVIGKGIYELKNSRITLVPNSDILAGELISGMIPISGTEILIVTQTSGLYKYDGYNNFSKWAINGDKFFKNNKIVSSTILSNGYALGSSYNGLLIIDRQGNPKLHLNKERGLQNNGVEYIYLDNSGNLWLALRDGIDYVEINSPFSLINPKSGISGSGFTSIVENNKLYLGTSDGLYYKDVAASSNPLDNSSFTLIPSTAGQTYNLQKIDKALLLSHHNGLYQITGNQAKNIFNKIGTWKFISLGPKSSGYLLCGAYNGLYLFRIKDDNVEYLRKITGFNESSRIMEQDEEGNVWVAHGYKGVYKIKLSENLEKVEKINFYNSQNGFPSNVFINVFKIDNELVFTGERGIYRYDARKDGFVEHDEFNKLIDKTKHTRKLIEDKEGNVWFAVADETGVLRRRNNGNYDVFKTQFNKLERRLVGGFEQISYFDDHNVIIGIDEGFVHYDPSFVDKNDRSFNTVIRRVESTNAKDSLLTAGSFSEFTSLSLNQPDDKVPVLPYYLNSIRFIFSAMSFEDIDKVQYQYLLEGHDKNWSAWTKSEQKEYTNLHEGEYVFRIKAKDIYNHESNETTFRFFVKPPWYRSIWAYGLYCIFIICLFLLVWKVTKLEQQRAMRLKEAKHMEEVLKAEKEIIKLNNEKLEIELSHKTKELTSSAIHVVHNVETIQKLRTQLLQSMETVKDKDALYHMRKLQKSIESELNIENNWEQFEFNFNQIHQDFLKRLRNDFPQLTQGDIKLCAYLRLNLSSKEIASLLNISIRGVEATRYRLRKRLNLSPEENLLSFIARY